MDQSFTQTIHKLFSTGKIPGLYGDEIPEHIETMISDVYLFKKTVYKLYKWNSKKFNSTYLDISNPTIRTKFYTDDFKWNHYFNKHIYIDLLGVNVSRDSLSFNTDITKSHDAVIKMNRIDEENNVTNLLKRNALSIKELECIGAETTKTIAEFPNPQRTQNNWYTYITKRLKDTQIFLNLAKPSLNQNDIDTYMQKLNAYVARNQKQLKAITPKFLSISIDNHSDNVFYQNGKTTFIDIFLPVPDWQLADPFFNICRLSADVWAYTDKAHADGLVGGFQKYYTSYQIDNTLKLFYQLYSACIMVAYKFLISDTKTALKYKTYLDEFIGEI
ncbi:MAG TPA: hypothetical protein ENI63_01925 [Candidatus Kaiserbacteria bacterium]|nr:hypothetical protein [Candidatus Kaiserbacteria bacterium]